jgi:outer membrane protein
MKGLVAGIVVTLTIITVPVAAAQGLKIGYVNGFRVENESATARRAFDVLKKEFMPRERELQQMEKRIAGMKAELEKMTKTATVADRLSKEKSLSILMGQFQQAQQNFAEDLEVRRREEHTRLISAANAAIRVIAESGHYDLIVQESVYSSPRIDISQRVLDEMAKHLTITTPAN